MLKELAKHAGERRRESGHAAYTKIQRLGAGSAGSVHLVKSSLDGKFYALKVIEFKTMSPLQRKQAENEISLLKVLNGPNIIKYYESFREGDALNIIMEYAENGSIHDKIEEHKLKGEYIPNEKVLSCIDIVILRFWTGCHR
mgnify:CR=1 FL=1